MPVRKSLSTGHTEIRVLVAKSGLSLQLSPDSRVYPPGRQTLQPSGVKDQMGGLCENLQAYGRYGIRRPSLLVLCTEVRVPAEQEVLNARTINM